MGKDQEPGTLSVTEEDRAGNDVNRFQRVKKGDDDWLDPDPSWADEF